jgi:hypothetical protein
MMKAAMGLSVHITTPRLSRESLIKMLRIPKARQKELLAIMREPAPERSAAPKIQKTSRRSTRRSGETLQRAADVR